MGVAIDYIVENLYWKDILIYWILITLNVYLGDKIICAN